MDVADNVADCPIPPGMVITLTENAIKHGIEPSPRGGRIDVVFTCDGANASIVVTDTGAGFASGLSEGGIGLANIRERIALIYGDRASLSLEENAPRGFRARIVLPDARAQQSIPPVPSPSEVHS